MKFSVLGVVASLNAVSAFQVQPSLLKRSPYKKFNNIKQTSTPSTTTSALSVVDVSENANRDLGSFDQWATECGVQRADGFQLTTNDGNDYSVMTEQQIAADTPVLYVPSDMILSSRMARQEFGMLPEVENQLASAKAGDGIEHFYLFLKILSEYMQGEDSAWYPWLNSLPRFYSNGASMTLFCFDCLPPFAGWLASNERIRFTQFFESLKFVPFVTPELRNKVELAKWAFAVVHTRCFETPDGDVKIVPMADMFNHGADTEAECVINYDGDGNAYAYSKFDIPAGYPLRISYGDFTNPSKLLARYGFLDESSPASFCKIMITDPDQRLIDMGYDYSKMLFFKETGEVSEEVWDVLLYMNLANEPEQQQAFYNAHVNGDYDTKQQYHQHYFQQTLGSLQNHVNNFLGELDQLSRKADGKNVREHPRLPLIQGHNEFVKQTFLKVKNNIDNM